MFYLVLWWLTLILLGLAAFPLAWRFLAFLPDRGYAFGKPLGLLALVFPFWLLAWFGFLQNTFAAIALLLIAGAVLLWSSALRSGDKESPWTWLREHWDHALAVELVFSIAYFGFAYYRAFNPEIQLTEKPMEFMFLNSMLKSTTFPPHDAWWSGSTISYYYLGYVIVAALTKLTSIPSNYAFNLGLIGTYAMGAAAVFGLVYDLIKGATAGLEQGERHGAGERSRRPDALPYVFGVLAVFLLLVVGNLETPFESLHNIGAGSPGFYQWLDVNGLANAPQSGSVVPQDQWWWWRASRVVNDHNPTTGDHTEVIDEFPSFSFLLGDLHPHVLALPFDLLALAIALNGLAGRRRTLEGLVDISAGLITAERLLGALVVALVWLVVQFLFGIPSQGLAGAIARDLSPGGILAALIVGLLWLLAVVVYQIYREGADAQALALAAIREWLNPYFLLTAVVIGSLGMLNTWDIVTYGFIVVAAFAVNEFRLAGQWSRRLFAKTGLYGISLLALSYLFYLPFYLGFSSQVKGVAPNVFFKTPLHQYLLMFGLYVFVLISFVGLLIWQRRESLSAVLQEAGAWTLLMLTIPVVIVVVGLLVLSRSTDLQNQVATLLNLGGSKQLLFDVAGAYVSALLTRPGLFLLLCVMIAGIIAVLHRQLSTTARTDGGDLGLETGLVVALLLAFTAFLLTFGVEFLYVRDTFETRMNTVFKLYFQAWTLFSVAAAFGAFYIWKFTGGIGRTMWALGLGVLLAMSMAYPVLAYPNRANNFEANSGAGLPTLDGTLWIENLSPDEYAAIEWLNSHAADNAVILEANGQEYSNDSRISEATGLQTVLGWGVHELQWGRNVDQERQREQDIANIYKSLDQEQARQLLGKYGVQYIVVGAPERDKFGLARPMIDKFSKLGRQVFSQGSTQIFQVQ